MSAVATPASGGAVPVTRSLGGHRPGLDPAIATLPPSQHPLRLRIADWRRRLRRVLGVRPLAMALGATMALWGLAGAGWIEAKAIVAQVLLRQAWARSVEAHAPARPWPWADTWPVARLTVPRLDVDQIVLAGASGRTLAFGPALSPAGAAPGATGSAVISGHRDTHFAFLRELGVGDRIWVEAADGRHAYVVESAAVVDAHKARLPIGGEESLLALVTCWPFDAVVPGGPLRYLVTARLEASTAVAL
jgi:sortase A